MNVSKYDVLVVVSRAFGRAALGGGVGVERELAVLLAEAAGVVWKEVGRAGLHTNAQVERLVVAVVAGRAGRHALHGQRVLEVGVLAVVVAHVVHRVHEVRRQGAARVAAGFYVLDKI